MSSACRTCRPLVTHQQLRVNNICLPLLANEPSCVRILPQTSLSVPARNSQRGVPAELPRKPIMRNSIICWAVRCSNTRGVKIFRTLVPGFEAHPTSCKMSTRSFPGVNCPERGVDYAPRPSAEVIEIVDIYCCCPSGPSWPIVGDLYLSL